MPEDPNDAHFARLCELQQLQLEKLEEISKQLAGSAESAGRAHEEYMRQGVAYDQALSASQASDRVLVKVVTWRAVIIAMMLALIAVAIFLQSANP
ncbi:MAG: hypothetical protein H7Y36_00455 [Armatimonadetes bacterium]|nr:hypothetical protein [Akkermansiaceae bacterium]